jgi:predicted AAA+ superfamily ATPase
LEVLPIVGPPRVGKSTLVAHVCKDERVQGYFSEILWLNDLDFTDDELALRQGYAMKHQNQVSNSNNGKRLLVVIELSGDLHEDDWNRFYLASKRSFCRGSKIIVTSSSDRVVKFGTAHALTLKHLSHEAYWYFFKTLAFGSMDPKTHPRHAQLSMEIARTQKCSIIGACITSYWLRNNFDIHFWCKVLSFWRRFIQKHVSKFGKHPFDLLSQNRPIQGRRMATPSEYFMICRRYQCSSQEEVPKIRSEDVVYGNVKAYGKFEVLTWRSEIPPYYSYVSSYEIQERKTTSAKGKHSMKGGVTFW